MENPVWLLECVYFFAATVSCVPLFKWLKLGNVLGYLFAGMIIGPFGLGLIEGENNIFQLAELGLILLLFVIGLEISPRRISTLRKHIFLDGSIQFGVTTMVLTGIGMFFNLDWKEAIVVGIAFSLSSTAFVLSYLKETKQITLSYGQSSFSILLFQDLIIIPVLAILPFLAIGHSEFKIELISLIGKTLLIITVFIFLKICLRPLMKFSQSQSRDVFTAFCFLIVMGLSMLAAELGMSKALGAFLAGVLLSDSIFKHEVENVITPFKGMLMGVFFMSFGMKFDIRFFLDNWFSLVGFCVLVFGVKMLVLDLLGRFRMKTWKKGHKLALLMCQGSEFGLIVLNIAGSLALLSNYVVNFSISIILLGLFVAPVFSKLSESIRSQEEVPPSHLPGEAEEEKDSQVKIAV